MSFGIAIAPGATVLINGRSNRCVILGLAFFACKSDAERQDQARQKAQSWIATSEMVVAQWKANRVPTAYAHHTLREARDKLRSLHRPDAARWADSLDKSLP